jgi:hypothetical protein
MSDHTRDAVLDPRGGGWGATAVAALSLVALVTLAPVVATAAPAAATGATTAGTGSPVAVDPGANESADAAGTDHPKVADGLLSRSPTPGSPTDAEPVAVVVETVPNASGTVVRAIERYGTVVARGGTLIQAELPRSAVVAVADRDAVEFVRPPYRIDRRRTATDGTPTVGNVTSEGVAAIGAGVVHDANYTGEDVTVAVVDTEFDVDDPEIASAVADTKDFSGAGFGAIGGDHGTATAAIVADTAPDADLQLVKAQSYTQLVEATEWIANQSEIDVVSLSLGLRGGMPLDGTARLDREIAESVRNGTVWMSSVGNQGDEGHWNGTWSDPDGDDWLNFEGSDENLSVEGPMSVDLQWSDWNGSDQDYDLYVYDEDGEVVTSSETTQSGSQDPVEVIKSVAGSGTYHLKIRKVNADGDADFDLFYTPYSTDDRAMEYTTRARTVTVPATGPRTTAVGAVNVSTLALQPYSSRGPTIDGRRKPAFVAPDAVTTGAIDPFEGTSAAAPHAAGAAALVLDADPTLSPGAVVDRLSETADPRNYSGVPNNRVGVGLINVTDAVRPQDPVATLFPEGRIDALDVGAVPVVVRFGAVPDGGDVVVELRDGAGGTVTERTAADTGSRETVVTVDASSLADGPVTARAKVVDGLGAENAEGFTATSDPVTKNTSALALALSQSVAPATVAPDGTATVTARVRPTAAADRLSLVSSFEGNVSGVAIEAFRVDGEGTTLFSQIDGDEATFAAQGVGANATVVATFEVRVGADAESGAVAPVTSEATAGPATVSVTTKVAVGDGIAVYADGDGVIRTSGLQAAIRDWATGEMTTDRLQRVIRAWATGEKVT